MTAVNYSEFKWVKGYLDSVEDDNRNAYLSKEKKRAGSSVLISMDSTIPCKKTFIYLVREKKQRLYESIEQLKAGKKYNLIWVYRYDYFFH
jgi:hypothetical protein